MTGRTPSSATRSYAVSLIVLALVSLTLVAVRGRPWSDGRTGSELVALIAILPAVSAATIAAIIATAGRMRQAIGGALVGLAVVALVATASAPDLQWWPWPLLAAFSMLAMAAVGGLTVARSRTWPTLSSRYQRQGRPPGEASPSAQDQWRALDEGRDPTL